MAKLYDSQIKKRMLQDDQFLLESFDLAEESLNGRHIYDLIDTDKAGYQKLAIQLFENMNISFDKA